MFWLFICVFLVFVTATSYLASDRGISKWDAAGSVLVGGILLLIGLAVAGVVLLYAIYEPSTIAKYAFAFGIVLILAIVWETFPYVIIGAARLLGWCCGRSLRGYRRKRNRANLSPYDR